MHLAQVASATLGQLTGADTKINSVVTDSRADCTGGLFVALKGDNFDAHDFIHQAEVAGAAAVLVERKVQTNLPSVQVEDTLQALGRLAKWWREQFDIPLMAITGSVGKTTVKEMLAVIFSQFGEGIATKGNLNNEIGVPLTLLRLREAHRYAIVEMGMNHAGEIHRLSTMAQPSVAMVNNAGAAHLEGLGSIAAVAQAKGEIFNGLKESGVAVINIDDEFCNLWQQGAASFSQLLFGFSEQADIKASYQTPSSLGANGSSGTLKVTMNLKNEFCSFELHSLGEHSVRNALAAAAVASAVNVPLADIAAGLEQFRPIQGRLNIDVIGDTIVIDDTYNANPASMNAAIDVLASYQSSVLIVGDMAELGEASVDEHRALGAYAQSKGITELYACGDYAPEVVNAFDGQAVAYSCQAELLEQLPLLLCAQAGSTTVLVKGSRSARMERVVAAINNFLSTQLSNSSEVH